MVKMGAVWDRTMKFIGANTGAVVTIALAAIFAPTLVGQALQLALADGANAGAAAVAVFISLAATIVSLLGQIALVALAIDATLGVGGAFAVGGRRLLPVIGVSLVMLLLFMLLFLPVFAVVFGSGADWALIQAGDPAGMPEISGGTAIFVGLYSLALLPVMFWLFARLSVLLPVIVWERLGLGAITRSFRLTSGYALKIIGVYILFIIIFFVASLAIGGVFGAIFALAAGGIQGLTVGGVLMAIITVLLSTIFTVISSVFLTKLYKSLIEDREPAAVFE